MTSVQDAIFTRIRRLGRGKVFTAKDFHDLAERASIDQSLSRLARSGDISRLGRGLYYYPTLNARLGIPVAPSTDDIAEAIARQTGSRIVPSGAVAANRLGLSTQVPVKAVYLSDGGDRSVKVGELDFEIKHVAPKELPLGSPLTAMVIQALRYVGKDAIGDQVIASLRQSLSAEQRRELLKDAQYTTDWITDVIKRLATTEETTHG